MPWKKTRDARCPAGKPIAVVKVDDNGLEGCHATDAAANAQLAALNAAEREAKGMDEETQEKEPVSTDEVKEEKTDGDGSLPGGPTTFADLRALREAAVTVASVRDLTMDFGELANNIMCSPTVEDKAGAMRALAEEFAALVERPPEEKAAPEIEEEDEEGIIAAIVNFLGLKGWLKAKPMKTEGGTKYPATDYAFVPDPSQPSTWKLRLTESPGKVTVRQLGRAAAALSPGGFRGRKVQLPSSAVAGVKRRIRAEYRKLGVEAGDMPESVKELQGGFMVYKTAAGDWRWAAAYTNKYRDEDQPPEILSEAAHQEFVQAVKSGEWEYPELWLWHVKGSRCGQADYLAYDDTGFQVAVGHWDTGREWVAEALSGYPGDLAVSHGMPTKEIRRDETDPTVIIRYRTREISPLPPAAAANKLTGFTVLKEHGGESMALQEEDKEKLDELLGEGSAQRIEDENAARGEKAIAEELESKDQETADEAAATDTEGPVEQGAAEPLTVEAIAEAVSEPLRIVTKRQDEQAQALEALTQTVNGLMDIITKMQRTDEERIAETIALSPAASLKQMIAKSVVGAADAKVHGNSKLAKDKPPEAEPLPEHGQTGIPLVDALIAGEDWRTALGGVPAVRQQ